MQVSGCFAVVVCLCLSFYSVKFFPHFVAINWGLVRVARSPVSEWISWNSRKRNLFPPWCSTWALVKEAHSLEVMYRKCVIAGEKNLIKKPKNKENLDKKALQKLENKICEGSWPWQETIKGRFGYCSSNISVSIKRDANSLLCLGSDKKQPKLFLEVIFSSESP